MAKYNEKKMIDELRLLSLDMIHSSGEGSPIVSFSSAPIIYTLLANHLVIDEDKPNWPNRDRLVISSMDSSAIFYACLYATTSDLSMDDIRDFGHIHAKLPGVLELDVKNRMECLIGNHGMGFATAVGLSFAESYLEKKYNTKDIDLFNYNIYCVCSEADLMEGISYEAATLAGMYELNNLIVLYDANGITNDSSLPKGYHDNIASLYDSIGWLVINVRDGNKISDLSSAIKSANKSKKPVLIIVNSNVKKDINVDNLQLLYSNLLDEDLHELRIKLGGNSPYEVNEDAIHYVRSCVKKRNLKMYDSWYEDYKVYTSNMEKDAIEQLNAFINNEDILLDLDKVIDKDKIFVDRSMRDINYQVMNVISVFIDRFIGGSSDAASKTKAVLKNGGDFGNGKVAGKNIAFGCRESVMGAIMNGLALTNFRPFCATFLVNADYLKTAIRMSAMMSLPVTYIFTDDTILSCKNGISFMPIEQLGGLRSIPNLEVYRPCDYKELIGSWNLILRNKCPSALIVSRDYTQSYKFTSVNEVSLGGYVISEVRNRLDLILVASGTEVSLAMRLKQELLKNFIEARVVSMPNITKFFQQSKEYQNQVLPKGYKCVFLELSNDVNMYRLVKDPNDIIWINKFGYSGTKEELLKEFSLDVSSLVIRIKDEL